MATKIIAYQAKDGTIFTSQKEATNYDNKDARQKSIELLTRGFDDENDWVREWLLDNADEIIAALTVKPEPRTRRTKAEMREPELEA